MAAMTTRHLLMIATSASALLSGAARAQTAPQAAQQSEEVTVVASTPLLGSGVDRSLIPAETQVLSSAQIAREGAPDLLQALGADVAGVNLDNGAGNPFQPTLYYNGFAASPLQGTPQGIAVYVNGVRFNSAFGDTVNWDLLPQNAISRVNVEGSNPVFGLNALGGAMNVSLKDGFSTHGGEAEISGGSFGQVQGELQYGVQSGNQALYVAGSIEHEGGWRDLQSSDIQNFYGDWGARLDGAEIHLDLTLANSSLNGPGTAPIQLLDADSRGQFTAPNLIANKYAQFEARGNFAVSDTLSVQADAYYSYFQQHVVNGNTADDTPCDDGSGLLCQAPGVPSTTLGGATIADFLHGGPYSELDTQVTNTNAYGGAAQVTDTGDLFGLHNHLVAGVSFDGAQTTFSAAGFIGGLTEYSRDFTTPDVIIDEPGNNVPVRAGIEDSYAGAYLSDTLNLTRALAVTLSGRYNFAEIDLRDQNGGDLTGNHAYARFDPAIGATYRVTSWLTAYAGYSEANRAPTPAELSCAGPQNSCSLANFFVGDPDLKQVVAHTVEFGLRGHVQATDGLRIGYNLDLYRTDSDDDIVFENSPTLNRAFFVNIGQTRRQGVSARLDARWRGITAYAAYTYTEATFQSGYVESAGSNPDADANGDITIRSGDTLPGVPRQVLKIGADADLTERLHAGFDGLLQSGQYLFGDEANLTPRLPGFFTLNLHGSYDVTPRLQLFASAQNVLDRRYYTYGTFSPTSSVYLYQAPNATDPRSYSLAAPIGFFGGVRVKF